MHATPLTPASSCSPLLPLCPLSCGPWSVGGGRCLTSQLVGPISNPKSVVEAEADMAVQHADEYLPVNTPFWQAEK